MTITIIVILILSGVAVGFINTLSAGGTAVSIALYLAMGIPVQAANAINRVGVLVQNGFTSYYFYRQKLLDIKSLAIYAIPVMIGAVAGALVAVNIDEQIFSYCFAVVLVLTIVFLFIKQKTKEEKNTEFSAKKYFIALPFFLLCGLYGGFIQTGTGFLLIAAVRYFLGYDMVRVSAAKVMIMFLYTLSAMAVFLIRGGIDLNYWIYGLLHAIGNIIGSYIAAKYAIKKGSKFVNAVIIAVIILTALNLFGIFDLKIIFKNIIE